MLPGPLRGSGAPRDAGIQQTMFRALAVLRVVVLLNTLVLYALHAHAYAHPAVGWVAMALLVAWSAVASVAYARPRRRPWVFAVDLAVAVVTLLATSYVKDAGFSATLPGFWVAAVVLAWAVHWRVVGGLVAAVVVSACDLAIRSQFGQSNYGNIFLLVIGAGLIGFLTDLLEETAAERDRAQRAAASAYERQRLARAVHDGVLQVLTIVQRRAPELGPQGAELGALAGEQEVALRALVQRDAHVEDAPTASGESDLGAALAALQRPQVQVSLPGVPVTLPEATVTEVVAVVEACLSNVRHHVGRDAPAWVLLEDLGREWVVTVRDDGPGIAAGRLEAAAAEGRLGVAESIRGRVEDLGARARLTTAPGQGTEWEFRGSRG